MGIIVTVWIGKEDPDPCDIEIPHRIPIKDLIPLMTRLFPRDSRPAEKGQYHLEHRLDGRWRRLDPDRSLHALSIQDGDQLRILSMPSHSSTEAPTPHTRWQTLFPNIGEGKEEPSEDKSEEKERSYAWKLLE